MTRFCKYLLTQIYEGDVTSLKFEPIIGTCISILTISGIDRLIGIAHIVGAITLTIITVSIGVLLPMILRFVMHRFKTKYPILAELLKHDKKEKE